MDEMCRKMAERMSLGDFTNEQGKEGAKGRKSREFADLTQKTRKSDTGRVEESFSVPIANCHGITFAKIEG